LCDKVKGLHEESHLVKYQGTVAIVIDSCPSENFTKRDVVVLKEMLAAVFSV
jgi:hypothetical protein